MKDERCENIATIKRVWAGKPPDAICVEHAQDTQKVAEAMGVYVHLEPIGYSAGDEVPSELPICCCSKGFSQKITMS